MAKAKAWKQGAAGEPRFPDDFEVLQKAVLQVTDIKTNRNKYYAVELHKGEEKGRDYFRVFTHYGRTDDLETNPDAGARESRYHDTLAPAQAQYQSIYNQKTSARKGYKELSLASSKIGSQKSRGQSSGDVDQRTLEKMASAKKLKPKKSKIAQPVQDLVSYLYEEATNALTGQVAATITANGIETPLGVLTVGQIEKGEEILGDLYGVFQKKRQKKATRTSRLEVLSGEFYTVIPHRIGRSRAAVATAVIDSLEVFQQKQELLQLMKDMLQVNGDENVLFDPEIDKKYDALGCQIEALGKLSLERKQIANLVLKSQIKSKTIKIRSVFKVKRDAEWNGFRDDVKPQRMLFHGSRIGNWVGLLSRGLLMPKIVVSMGIGRTDPGWLGHGIYFGDASCTSAFYTTPGKKKTRFMGVFRVALGKAREYRKITYGLSGPPKGFDSCHGLRNKLLRSSEFADDEYVIYDTRQQRQEYLVEFTA